MAGRMNRDHDLYGYYVSNKVGYSKDYHFCLNYCHVEDEIDYICLLGEKRNYHKTENTCLGNFVYDYHFDTIDGIYNAIIYKQNELLASIKEFLNQFKYVINYDYSTYMSMGKNIIINQITKSRIVCQWINEYTNATCIPVITFSLKEYDNICLEGIVRGSAVAISLESCLQSKEMRDRLTCVIKKVVDSIRPECIVIYTTSVKTDIYSMFKYAVDNNIKLVIPSTLMNERNASLLGVNNGKRK
jgi:hypothetical protein